jgi:hypothetical protein
MSSKKINKSQWFYSWGSRDGTTTFIFKIPDFNLEPDGRIIGDSIPNIDQFFKNPIIPNFEYKVEKIVNEKDYIKPIPMGLLNFLPTLVQRRVKKHYLDLLTYELNSTYEKI